MGSYFRTEQLLKRRNFRKNEWCFSYLRRYFPNVVEATKLADFADTINYWLEVMNSYTHKGPFTCILVRVRAPKESTWWAIKRCEVLVPCKDVFLNVTTKEEDYEMQKCSSNISKRNYVTYLFIQSLKSLFYNLQTRNELSFILTHRNNQDCLDNFISQVRGKRRFKEHPNPVERLYNIRSIILSKSVAVTKQLHANTIDILPDEYVTSSFRKQSSESIASSSTSVVLQIYWW